MTKILSGSKVSSMVIGDYIYITDGATVTPVDDYTIWLKCAGVTDTFRSLANVIANADARETLCNNINALRYMVRSEDVIMPAVLANANWLSELDVCSYAITTPTMTSATAPSGVVSATNQIASLEAYKAFNKDATTKNAGWLAETGVTVPVYIQYQFANTDYRVYKTKLTTYTPYSSGISGKFKIQGSTDGTSFVDLVTNVSFNSTFDTIVNSIALAETNGLYQYFRLVYTELSVPYIHKSGDYALFTAEVEFYVLDLY